MTFREKYLASEPDLMQLYAAPASLSFLPQILESRKSVPVDRHLLSEVLRNQYGPSLPEAVRQNIHLLETGQAYTITTGQQIGLLGGPLYTIYKTITTIRLAQEATSILGIPVVPVFWMASEDHDVAEVDHFFTGFTASWNYTGPASGPVGRHVFTDHIQQLLNQAGLPAYATWFRPGVTWSQAFREMWVSLFSKYGLVVLEPDDSRLKTAIRPAIRADLLANAGYEGVSSATARLEKMGFNGQVAARDPNFFLLADGLRKKVTRRSDQILVGMEQEPVSVHHLLQLLEDAPEMFSPNVVLRPIYQELVLPNLAYVGGWAEIAYWGQFKDVFHRCELPMPMVWPRMSLSLLREEDKFHLNQLGYEPKDLERPLHELKYAMAERLFQAPGVHHALQEILIEIEQVGNLLNQDHPTLKRSAESWKVKSQVFFTRLERRRLKLLMDQHPATFRDLEKLKNHLKTDGFMQERTWSLAAIAPTEPHAMVDILMSAPDPLSPTHRWHTISPKNP